MIQLYLWDDARARRFAPFALTRPVAELRAGALVGRERWERLFDAYAGGFVGAPHLADFDEPGGAHAVDVVPAGAVIANSRALPAAGADAQDDADAWSCDGRLAAVRVSRDVTAAELRELPGLEALARDGAHPVALVGRWLDEVWDVLAALPSLLAEDVRAIAAALEVEAPPPGVVVLGEHEVHVERGATIEPYVCLDATAGPILVRRGASVASFTRLVGPCYVGEHSSVLGGRIAVAGIGEWCKVHGEVNTVVFHSYANKAHDGFVGHSLVGRWANLGAGTTTSNLKNTYSTVQLWTPDGFRDTGLQFAGTLFGDHVKTGIGTMLNTGTVLGAGSNVFGGVMPPKMVPPFGWGSGGPYDCYDLERFIQVAERAMARRQQSLSERARRQLAAAHAATMGTDA